MSIRKDVLPYLIQLQNVLLLAIPKAIFSLKKLRENIKKHLYVLDLIYILKVTLSDPESPFTQNSCLPPGSFQTN